MTHFKSLFAAGLAVYVFALAGCGASDTSKAASETFAASISSAPLIDPNSATIAELTAIAGLGEAGAQKIIAGRPFATPGALHAAISEGMSEEDLRSVYSVMFVKVGLNSGDLADYKLIPSTLKPGKLAHEFEEYRPYESMDQFEREMGKYVSEKEVVFLARYLTLD